MHDERFDLRIVGKPLRLRLREHELAGANHVELTLRARNRRRVDAEPRA